MFSQSVFVLKIAIKQAFPLLVHKRFLFKSEDDNEKEGQLRCGADPMEQTRYRKTMCSFIGKLKMSFLNKIKLRPVVWFGESKLNSALILVVFQSAAKHPVRRCLEP